MIKKKTSEKRSRNFMEKKYNKVILENDKVYYVVWKTKIKNECFYYIISEDKNEMLFCEIDENDFLTEITDATKIKKIVDIMTQEIKLFYE